MASLSTHLKRDVRAGDKIFIVKDHHHIQPDAVVSQYPKGSCLMLEDGVYACPHDIRKPIIPPMVSEHRPRLGRVHCSISSNSRASEDMGEGEDVLVGTALEDGVAGDEIVGVTPTRRQVHVHTYPPSNQMYVPPKMVAVNDEDMDDDNTLTSESDDEMTEHEVEDSDDALADGVNDLELDDYRPDSSTINDWVDDFISTHGVYITNKYGSRVLADSLQFMHTLKQPLPAKDQAILDKAVAQVEQLIPRLIEDSMK